MDTITTGLREIAPDLHVIPDAAFHRLTEREFGMPGLVAIESVGPFVEVVKVGPFITIHDSFLDPGLGIGHHPHRTNERLFYILEGEIRHDDSLNDIQGVMGEGDIARLTEGTGGMLHKEWNGRDDARTHAFILVYTPDVEPPIERAAFAAHRASEMPLVEEAPGVATLHVLGGSSGFRANLSTIHAILDTRLDAEASLDVSLEPNEGLVVYPLEGSIRLAAGAGDVRLAGRSRVLPEGPDGVGLAWSDDDGRSLRVEADGGPARFIRVAFGRGEHDLIVKSPEPSALA